MKRLLAAILAACMMLPAAGCAAGQAVSSSGMQQGTVTLPSEDNQGGDAEATKPTQQNQTQQTQQQTQPAAQPQQQQNQTTPSAPQSSSEYRAVWISYLELSSMLTGKSESQFRSNISAAFSKAAKLGLNTVIVHVRPFGDALYNSSIFPTSYLITGKEGASLPFDPLAIMISEAHSKGLSFEAWINPYRVRASSGRTLSSGNPAQQFLNEGSDAVYTYNGGVYYNPGSSEAVDLIVRGVEEIVRNYDVDGIHFDDYFYATRDSSIDSGLYSAYCSNGGGMSLGDWRRSNVNSMVHQVYSAVKSIKSSVRFGISPQGNMSSNYSVLYADVATWVGNSGYVDYICPQIYYSFNHSTCAFEKVLDQFNSMIKTNSVKLYVGLAAYKAGKPDSSAGSAAKMEWVENTDMLGRMVTASRQASHYDGFALYSYNSIFNPSSDLSDHISAELNALTSVL